jgi:Tfp pilus assembly protein FimV
MDEDGIAPVAIAEGDGVRENPEGENEIEEVDDEEDEDEDDDEDDEDFEDEDDPHQAANGAQNNANDDPDIIEGGIAENDEPGKLAAEADIVSIFIFRCWAVLFGVADTPPPPGQKRGTPSSLVDLQYLSDCIFRRFSLSALRR